MSDDNKRRIVPGNDLLASFWDDPLDFPRRPFRPRRKTKSGRTLALVTVVVIGMLLAVAWRHATEQAPEAADARQDLRDDVVAQREDNAELAQRAEDLRAEVAQQRDRLIGGREQVRQLHDAEAIAGLRAVTGDGATITLTDAPDATDPQSSNPGKVLDRDLQLAANTLWAYGAEAIAIGDERLTATSSIRAAGDAIMIDVAPISSPYEITAIGPPDLADRFADSPTADTFTQYSTKYGMSMSVAPSEELRLPAAATPVLDNATVGETK